MRLCPQHRRDVSSHMRTYLFRYTKYYHRLQAQELALDMFNDPKVQEVFQVRLLVANRLMHVGSVVVHMAVQGRAGQQPSPCSVPRPSVPHGSAGLLPSPSIGITWSARSHAGTPKAWRLAAAQRPSGQGGRGTCAGDAHAVRTPSAGMRGLPRAAAQGATRARMHTCEHHREPCMHPASATRWLLLAATPRHAAWVHTQGLQQAGGHSTHPRE